MRDQRGDANKFMVDELMSRIDDIDNDYDEKFIRNMHFRISKGLPINENQEKYLEECFHNKY